MFICVFLASSQRIDPKYLRLAEEVGAELARRGHTLVSGGARVSCMGAVARAVRAGGGHTVGVIPQALVDIEVADTDSDELIVTADMRERKGAMDARSDAFLVLPGGIGTLEELFEIWTARTLGLHDKPLVLLDPWGLYAPLKELVGGMHEEGFTRAGVFDAISWTTTVEEAFELLEKPAGRLAPSLDELGEATAG
ncbi:cytokinin riboside 5'-monophosphate phosphoribohydrolase [Planomonospora parontospora subsp. parontospora]|uniref:Cytokinin riboside 5'-monophosphate phosphoribohydrolase n=2 Tax=Planomonospora parontospora TaxID=58119 RepID=A0AA37BGQ4_9ACTN|nr:TIGR00730 family Rossman fold protein [Planomonospora parontospora]GGK68909.1 cytokinin riboside 5'-monophosphate phosphoribohydrolase [Planomonospora parontospora]GII08980.1 cytokinin riboside 5'-monophosphate phosphoribohydrolase [Planomonospora parontospora subsp. parontospora]